MKFQLHGEAPFDHSCPVLVLVCFEGQTDAPLLARYDQVLGGAITALFRDKEFTGAFGTTKLFPTLGKAAAERLLLVGLGKEKEFTPERLRQAGGVAAQALKAISLRTCSVLVPEGQELPRAVAEGLALGSYSFNQYRTKPEEKEALDTVRFLVPESSDTGEAEQVLDEARLLCEAVRFARDLVSQPGNVATPSWLAEKALEMAALFDIPCHVWDREEIERHGMAALLAVARGSRRQPRFVTFEYRGAAGGKKPVVLVGKGITFDSGGISLKPREGMERMKNDMAGAAVVMGVMMAAASLKLPVNLVGLIPLAENLPDGNACKPGDVIRSLSGKTIEVVNTDAEGRLVLCDALHHALNYRPAAIIDVATLTGACVVALGNLATGLLSNDDALARSLRKAGAATGESVWQLPLWEEYGDLLKSDIADMKNSGGPPAGTITAAWFLKNFVGTTRWAHLDIAGTAWEEKGRHYLPKGATGTGVRLLVEYLRGLR